MVKMRRSTLAPETGRFRLSSTELRHSLNFHILTVSVTWPHLLSVYLFIEQSSIFAAFTVVLCSLGFGLLSLISRPFAALALLLGGVVEVNHLLLHIIDLLLVFQVHHLCTLKDGCQHQRHHQRQLHNHHP